MSSPDFRSSTDVPTGCCAYRRELARSQTTACAAIAFGRFAYIFISLHIKHAVINTHGRFNTDDNNHMIRMYTTCPRACVRESERSEATTTVAPCITRRRGGLSRRVKNKINFEKKNVEQKRRKDPKNFAPVTLHRVFIRRRRSARFNNYIRVPDGLPRRRAASRIRIRARRRAKPN